MLQQCETHGGFLKAATETATLSHYAPAGPVRPSVRSQRAAPCLFARNEQPRVTTRHGMTELDTGLDLLLSQLTALRQLPFRMEVD